jgi:hypothetical protein
MARVQADREGSFEPGDWAIGDSSIHSKGGQETDVAARKTADA